MDELGVTEDELSYPFDESNSTIQLPETVSYLGYDFNIWAYPANLDDRAYQIDFALEFDNDSETALEVMSDLHEKLSVNYGNYDYQDGVTYTGYASYTSDEILELIKSSDNITFEETWSVAEYGFSEYEYFSDEFDTLTTIIATLTLTTDENGEYCMITIRFADSVGTYGKAFSNYNS